MRLQGLSLLVNIFFLFSISYFIFFKSKGNPLIKSFVPALGLKLLAGVSVGLVYKYYYQGKGDTFQYFDNAARLSDIFIQDPAAYFRIMFFNNFENYQIAGLTLLGQPRAFTMVKIISPFALITYKSYWISSFYFSLFSFAGCWQIANVLANKFPQKKTASAIAFLYFPSSIFWASGVMKESILIGCICFSLAIIFKNEFNIVKILFILFSILIIWQIKYYYLAILIPVLASYFLTDKLFHKSLLWSQIIFLFLIFGFILLASTFIHPNLNINNFLHSVVHNHDLTINSDKNSQTIHFHNLQANKKSFIENTPLALISGLYRNFIWESKSVFQAVTGFENLILLLLSIFNLYLGFKKRIRISNPLLFFSTLIYIASLSVLLSLSSPNFGSLSRYKTGYLPFFYIY